MKTIQIIHKPQVKRVYQQPKIEKVKVDTDISLVMMSGPPQNPWMPENPEFIQKVFKFGF